MQSLFKLNDRVIVDGKWHGEIVNVSDYREPSMKYAVLLDDYHEDYVFVGEWRITHERAD